jgi:hypothetical protein
MWSYQYIFSQSRYETSQSSSRSLSPTKKIVSSVADPVSDVVVSVNFFQIQIRDQPVHLKVPLSYKNIVCSVADPVSDVVGSVYFFRIQIRIRIPDGHQSDAGRSTTQCQKMKLTESGRVRVGDALPFPPHQKNTVNQCKQPLCKKYINITIFFGNKESQGCNICTSKAAHARYEYRYLQEKHILPYIKKSRNLIRNMIPAIK